MTLKLTGQSSLFSAYQSVKWLDFIKAAHGYECFELRAENSALALALVKSSIFSNRLISLPFADYAALTGSPQECTLLAKKAIEIGKQKKVNFIEIRAPSAAFFKQLQDAGFEKRDDYCTFKLNISNLDSVLSGMEKRTRNDVTKSNKAGFTLKEATTFEDLQKFYSLYARTMKFLGSPPQSASFFIKMKKNLGDNCVIYLAYLNNTPVAGAVFLSFNDQVHYAYSCYAREVVNLRAVEFILWNAISNFSKKGFKFLDFGRTRFNSGVYNYKKGWGGVETSMPYFYYYFKQKIEQRDEVKYKKLSRIWSKVMPKHAAGLIGPWLVKQIG